MGVEKRPPSIFKINSNITLIWKIECVEKCKEKRKN